ncbi:MAG: MmcQ/YjbR family DNA-binding protein [Luteolibacter sp.]
MPQPEFNLSSPTTHFTPPDALERRPCLFPMDLSEARERCLSFPGVTEETPFGPEALVYKIGGKMFALISPEDVPGRMNLKCDPERSLDLRDRHSAIQPGYHMNKRHWHTLSFDGTLPSALIAELIDHSHQLVLSSLPKRKSK